jgi:hypothetical protein
MLTSLTNFLRNEDALHNIKSHKLRVLMMTARA